MTPIDANLGGDPALLSRAGANLALKTSIHLDGDVITFVAAAAQASAIERHRDHLAVLLAAISREAALLAAALYTTRWIRIAYLLALPPVAAANHQIFSAISPSDVVLVGLGLASYGGVEAARCMVKWALRRLLRRLGYQA